MLELGKRQSLTVVKTVDFGVYLSEGEGEGRNCSFRKKKFRREPKQEMHWKSSYIKIPKTVSLPPERKRRSSLERLLF